MSKFSVPFRFCLISLLCYIAVKKIFAYFTLQVYWAFSLLHFFFNNSTFPTATLPRNSFEWVSGHSPSSPLIKCSVVVNKIIIKVNKVLNCFLFFWDTFFLFKVKCSSKSHCWFYKKLKNFVLSYYLSLFLELWSVCNIKPDPFFIQN